jgi:hypothetical protein
MLAVASPAGAVLKRYGVHWTTISQFNTAVPPINKFPPAKDGSTAGSVGIVDDSGGGAPSLKRLTLVSDSHVTVETGGPVNALLYLSYHREEGPRRGLTFTGTGSTSMAIAWGLVTGWTVTGGFFCHDRQEPYVCTYLSLGGAGGKDLATVDPLLHSTFYDLGTWTFHGTGFTAVPFVHDQDAFPSTIGAGNAQYQLKGRLGTGLVPAVPVLGVALLGASLLFAGARRSQRR